MRLFLVFYLLIYSCMHVYAFLKLKAAFDFGLRAGIMVALFFIFMVLAPVIVRLSESAGHELFARFMAYAGYIWLAFIFLFFCSAFVMDMYRLVIWLAGLILQKDLSAVSTNARYSVFIPIAISACVCVYGYFEALNIQTENIVIETDKLPANVDRVRIAQISDVHVGLIVREERLALMLKKVEESRPDIVVSTGDLLDGQINGLHNMPEMFRNLNPKYGKYAVTGNHEFFAGLKPAADFINASGFRLLRNEAVTVDNLLILAGVDDPSVVFTPGGKKPDESRVLAPLPRNRFIVLLKHRPLIDEESAGLFDLQLSGHVHKGQIFPFSIVTHFYYKHQAGLLRFDGGILYISRGTGTWGPPIRFLVPPEVTVIDIVRKK